MPRRQFASSKIALLKSQVNALGVIIRLLQEDLIHGRSAAKELQRIQHELFYKLSKDLREE